MANSICAQQHTTLTSERQRNIKALPIGQIIGICYWIASKHPCFLCHAVPAVILQFRSPRVISAEIPKHPPKKISPPHFKRRIGVPIFIYAHIHIT